MLRQQVSLRFIWATAGCITLFSGLATGQCMQWQPGSGVPGILGTVRAVVEWDADGAGGQDPLLVVGGTFTLADSTVVSNVAVWNGSSWSTLGDGFNNTVRALAVYNGQLVAAGEFTASGANELGLIARWNGTSWQRFNTGDTADLSYAFGSVNALAVASGQLIAGGTFTWAGTNMVGITAVNYLARWDGTAWSAVNPSNPSDTDKGVNAGVNALAVVNGDLIAAGEFTTAGTATTGSIAANYIARWSWDGTNWVAAAMGPGLDTTAYSLAAGSTGSIYAGTGIHHGGEQYTKSNVVRWNPSTQAWDSVGIGMDSSIDSLAVMPNGDVVAGGAFNINFGGGTVFIKSLALWNGSTWSSLWPANSDGFTRAVNALVVRADGDLVAGGWFRSAGNLGAHSIAILSSGTWEAVTSGSASTSSPVTAMTTLANGDVVAGGGFHEIDGTEAHFVARWNGTAWSSMGPGLSFADDPWPFPLGNPVTSIVETSPGGDIVIGCADLATSVGGTRSAILRWNGAAWVEFMPTLDPVPAPIFFPPATPPHGVVTSLAMFQGDLYAGGATFIEGSFQIDGLASYLARWNNNMWADTGAGGGKGAAMLSPPNDGKLLANHLVVAGSPFEINNDPDTAGVAAWDGTSVLVSDDFTVPDWVALGKGTDGQVNALLLDKDGNLIIAGSFTFVGNAAPGDLEASGIARWNRTTGMWTPLASGISGTVNALALMPDGDIIAGGAFAAVGNAAPGDTPASNIARWNGASWSQLGSGVDDAVMSLAIDSNGGVLAGGSFTHAGGNVSAYFARYGCNIQSCPADFNGVNGVTVQDIFDFLTAWLAGNPSANFNGVNGVTVQDIFDFLTAWLAGC